MDEDNEGINHGTMKATLQLPEGGLATGYWKPAKGEVLVILDNDPLGATHAGWTCVMGENNVAPVS